MSAPAEPRQVEDPSPPNGRPATDLTATFQELANQWEMETGYMSSSSQIAAHPAGRTIVAMGEAAVPLILRRLEARPSIRWFLALREIVGDPPAIPEALLGKFPESAAIWLRWGREKGLIEIIPHLSVYRESFFPHLKRTEYRVIGQEDKNYNCIAHAAGNADAWWWPDAIWPEGVAREETLEAFIAALGTVGYVACDELDLSLEAGQEKVVLYVNAAGLPSHAARQLANGHWTSKLGDWEIIEHDYPSSLEAGPGKEAYGTVAKVLQRLRQ